MKKQPGDLISAFKAKKAVAENRLEAVGKKIRTKVAYAKSEVKKVGKPDVMGLKGIYKKK